MKFVEDFAGQNGLITPAALAVNQTPPQTISDQLWLLVLSGLVHTHVQGQTPDDWLHETIRFLPDYTSVLKFAKSSYTITLD